MRILWREAHASRIGHDDERALKQRVVGRTDDEVVRFVVGRAADTRLGQLREANREVDFGVRVISSPSQATLMGANLVYIIRQN